MSNTTWSGRLFDLGNQYAGKEETETALRCFHASCIADTDNLPAWQELALLQFKTQKSALAWQSIRHALTLNENSPRSLSIAGLIAADLENFNQAIDFIEKAKKQSPDDPNLDLIKVDMLRLAGDFKSAEETLDQAIQHGADPTGVELLHCELLQAQNRFDQLAPLLNRLLDEQPDLSRARLLLAETQLSQKNFADGWGNYEARLHIEEQPILRNYPWPYWSGENLQNKTILVHGEQGVGDEILFSSCLPDLLKRAGKVFIVLQERLSGLMTHSFPNLTALSPSEANQTATHNPQAVDYCVAIGSLPLHFRQRAIDFPNHNGYLRADEDWIQPWQEKLQTLGNGLRVGIAWQGGLMRTGQRARSLQPEQLLPLLELPDIQFVNIQHGKVRSELEWLAEKHNLPVTTWPLDTKNISELAGLVAALDLIITPCCSLVHLAGALGKPVWVMTPRVAAWRYLNEGETMPWYPSARLFRQPETGDWASVIESVRQELLANNTNQ